MTSKERLLCNNSAHIVEELRLISGEPDESITAIICNLAYHSEAKVRHAAYQALFHVRNSDLTEVIRDGLSDADREVLSAAAALFHRDDKKAA